MHCEARRVTTSAVVAGSCSLLAPFLIGAPALGVASDAPFPGGADPVASVPTAAMSPAVATGPVTPQVREIPVPDVDPPRRPRLAAQSAPQPVNGYGVVGATWLGAVPDGLRLAVRTRTGNRWSGWTLLHGGSYPCAACVAARAAAGGYGGDGPNPGSPEAVGTRAGTDPAAIGEVAAVQVRATSSTGQAPRDLTLSVINPGRSASDRAGAVRSAATTDGTAAATGSQVADVSLLGEATSGVRAPKPRLRLRRVWGADESLRSGSPRCGQVKAGVVHHTVNANDYSRADVPAIIRGIYAYHTQSLGWSDSGYNFLVDKFGRIWVGRYGGPRRAVIGAHTYGYNHLSTGAAAIGNFETRRPTLAMKRAFGRLLGWKLGVHGVRAGDREVWMEGGRFRAINGHRDAGQTACPGSKLYRRLYEIRRIAIRRQQM